MQISSSWLTYSGIIKDVRARIIHFVWRDEYVSRADLLRVYLFDVDQRRIDVWPL
jgi:hypothetical protein